VLPADLDTLTDRASSGMAGVERALGALQSKTLEALSASLLSRPLMRTQMLRYLRRLRLVPPEHAAPPAAVAAASISAASAAASASTQPPQPVPASERQGLDRLRVIHIGGTKGKGSTGAFVERILREHGVSTGLNTSPHLVSLNERIRLNGHPVSDELFIKHFWTVWDGLVATRDEAQGDPIIPAHFRFLTLVAFHLFLTHRVPPLLPSTATAATPEGAASDVAAHLTPIECVVLEVGLGGRLDATNVASAPVCVGFSSIGFDHQEVLGYTLREIASEKAGIIKPHCHAFSTANQSAEVREVFEAASAREQASGLTFVPALLPDELRGATLGLAGAHQYENAGLACALAWHFLCAMAREHPSDERFVDFRAAAKSGRGFDAEVAAHLPPKFLRALQRTRWPGRCQKLAHPSPALRDRVAFYVDGAHTDASMRVACDWFRELDAKERAAVISSPSSSSSFSSSSYTLLFNCGHVRDPIELMVPLLGLAHPSVDIGAAASTPHTHPSSTSAAASSTSSSPASSHPIRFARFLCAPFDHDRPHLSAAPTFEKLLRNHLLPMPRHSNVMLAKFAVMQKKERQQQYHLQPAATTTAAVVVEEQPKEALVAAATSSGSAAESVQIAPWIHPVLLRFLQARFAFPSPRLWEVERLLQQATADADAAADVASSSDSPAALLRSQLEQEQQRLQREVIAAQSALSNGESEPSASAPAAGTNSTFMALAEASIARVVAAFPPPQFVVAADATAANSSGTVVANATPASWQLTLFRVWTMVEQAFLCADEGDADASQQQQPQNQSKEGSACEYFPSVCAALRSIEAEALAAGPSAQRKVLGTGSLYLVGNVLHALDWHEEEAQRAASDQ
jgi:folylpolyglutamate synthase